MKIGFLAWNPFQIIQIKEIARCIPDSTLIVTERFGELDLIPEAFLKQQPFPVLEVDRQTIDQLDGSFDALVCQTSFLLMERFRKTKIVALQYSMAKEMHQYGGWRVLTDLNLAYGPYSMEKMRGYGPVRAVGNPRLDPWFTRLPDLKRNPASGSLNAAKKTLLYLPTWGELGSFAVFVAALPELSRRYNVLVKVHHNTEALDPDMLPKMRAAGALCLGAEQDSLELMSLADVVVSDLSGAIFDAIAVGLPVVLLQQAPEDVVGIQKFTMNSIEYARRSDIGPLATDRDSLLRALEEVISAGHPYRRQHELIRAECFSNLGSAGPAAAAAIDELVRLGADTRPDYQIYMRAALGEARSKKYGISRWARWGRKIFGQHYDTVRNKVLLRPKVS